MIIVHKIDDLAFDFFPELKADDNFESLRQKLVEYYSYGGVVPRITIGGGFVKIEIDNSPISAQQAEFAKATKLCERSQFAEAIPLLKSLIAKNPAKSEYHRVLGQAYSVTGDQESAMDCLIDALKWDPTNNYALLMMGNIFARSKNDFLTAKKYYDKVVENNPEDATSITKIGISFLQAGLVKEGLDYVQKAYGINPDYPDAIYGLALAHDLMGDAKTAFGYATACLKKCQEDDGAVRQYAGELAIANAKKYLEGFSGEVCFKNYHDEVERMCKRPVKVVEDASIETAAKIEYAETYNRDYHLVKFKPDYIGVYHLMMHELAHLHLATEARRKHSNMQFTSNTIQYDRFMSDFKGAMEAVVKAGIPQKSAERYYDALFDGMNTQIFNIPIDLFIEDRLFEDHEALRPIQFLSLLGIIRNGVVAVTDKTVVQFSPAELVGASKVLNLVQALLFKDLFGLDLTPEFNASPAERKQADNLFAEFYEYRDDREPGEEYELIAHWGEDLKLSKYFSLVKEATWDEPLTMDDALSNLEADPMGLDSDQEFKAEEMRRFLENQKEIGVNMAVVGFMVEALRLFEDKTADEIKTIAIDIAMQGMHGYNPEKKDYRVGTIPGKVFSGYHIMAYFYVSWALAMPESLAQLKMPFDREYKLAQMMYQ